MSVPVVLTKMHGALNDFLILDRRSSPLEALGEFARRVCDRRAGIGADGLIVLDHARDGVRLQIFNADGSEAEMCGNGVRCAARWLDEAGDGDRMVFSTAGGTVRTRVVRRTPEYLVRMTMPPPRILARSLDRVPDAVVVDVGNPHVVAFVPDAGAADLDGLASRLQGDPRFPGGINVHVVSVETSHRLRVRHWERGAGKTLACGTGAIAAVAAAIDAERASSPVEVLVPGGRLSVELSAEAAALTGPAVRIFETEVET